MVVIPFPTAVLADAFDHGGNDHDRRVAVLLYVLTAAAMSAPWLAFFSYLHRRPELLGEGISAAYVATQRVRPVTGMVLYLFSGALGWFVSPLVGVIGIVVMIVYHALTSEGVRRRRPPRRPGRG